MRSRRRSAARGWRRWTSWGASRGAWCTSPRCWTAKTCRRRGGGSRSTACGSGPRGRRGAGGGGGRGGGGGGARGGGGGGGEPVGLRPDGGAGAAGAREPVDRCGGG